MRPTASGRVSVLGALLLAGSPLAAGAGAYLMAKAKR